MVSLEHAAEGGARAWLNMRYQWAARYRTLCDRGWAWAWQAIYLEGARAGANAHRRPSIASRVMKPDQQSAFRSLHVACAIPQC